MRNLLTFLLRYQGVLLFVLLEVVALYLFITNSTYQRAAFFNSANAYAGALLARRTQVTDYFRLDELNQQLLADNARLRQQLFPTDYARREADSLPVRRDTLGRLVYRRLKPYPAGLLAAVAPPRDPRAGRYPDTLLLAGTRQPTHDVDYPLVPARVVNNSLRSVDNYLTLNVGAADGVQSGLGVLAAGGVVGRVKAVSAHYATVTSLLHSKTTIAAALKRDGTIGTVLWDGNDYRYAQLDNVPRQNRLVRGDTVVTSGYNAIFPPGVFIGTVESFVKEPDKNFWTVRVQLGVDFSRLTYVYVVHSRPRAERDSLEAAPEAATAPARPGSTPATRQPAPARPTRPAAPAARPATTAPAQPGTPAATTPQTGASLGRPDLTGRAAAYMAASQQAAAAKAAAAKAAAAKAAAAKAARANAGQPAPATPNAQRP